MSLVRVTRTKKLWAELTRTLPDYFNRLHEQNSPEQSGKDCSLGCVIPTA